MAINLVVQTWLKFVQAGTELNSNSEVLCNLQTIEYRKRNIFMRDDKESDNILTAGKEEMTLGGRLYASRQNAVFWMSLNLAARLLGVKIIHLEILGK